MASIRDEDGFNQGWSDSASTRVRSERRCDYMLSRMQISPEKNIIEIGCGTGTIAYMLAQKSNMYVKGSDCCVPFIEKARRDYQHPKLSYDVLEFTTVDPETLGGANYIVGNGILHHLYYNLEQCLISMRRLLKPGGRLIFLEPNLYNPYVFLIFTVAPLRKLARLEPDEMAFSKRYITGMLSKTGFTNITVEYRDFLLPGIPAAFITPSIVIGDLLERIPVVRWLSQSLFISADRSIEGD